MFFLCLPFAEAVTMKSNVTDVKSHRSLHLFLSLSSCWLDLIFSFTVGNTWNSLTLLSCIIVRSGLFFQDCPVVFVHHLQRSTYSVIQQFGNGVFLWASDPSNNQILHQHHSSALLPGGFGFYGDNWAVFSQDEVKGCGAGPTQTFEETDSFLTPPTRQPKTAKPLN